MFTIQHRQEWIIFIYMAASNVSVKVTQKMRIYGQTQYEISSTRHVGQGLFEAPGDLARLSQQSLDLWLTVSSQCRPPPSGPAGDDFLWMIAAAWPCGSGTRSKGNKRCEKSQVQNWSLILWLETQVSPSLTVCVPVFCPHPGPACQPAAPSAGFLDNSSSETQSPSRSPADKKKKKRCMVSNINCQHIPSFKCSRMESFALTEYLAVGEGGARSAPNVPVQCWSVTLLLLKMMRVLLMLLWLDGPVATVVLLLRWNLWIHKKYKEEATILINENCTKDLKTL